MTSFDLKELSPRHSDSRARRLRQIKKSVENKSYEMNYSLVAGDMIREAYSFETARRLAD